MSVQDESAPTPDAEQSVEFATIDELLGKGRATETITVELPGPDGPVARKLQFAAIANDDYEALQSQFPPTEKQKTEGYAYNIERFAPALVAACMSKPTMTMQQVQQIWGSDNWSTGELSNLYGICQGLCVGGFNIPKPGNG